MILFTGDMHGEIERFDAIGEKYPDLGENDCLIVCGDFGFLYLDSEEERERLDEIAKLPYTVCFVDGNHENFAALGALRVEMWNGGKAHKLRDNIVHLMRGQVFEIAGKKIFTMGGAYSVDRYVRTLWGTKVSSTEMYYWNEELPSPEEYREASENLKKAGMEVDYVVSHTAPRKTILEMKAFREMGFRPDPHDAELTGFLEWIMYDAKFSDWFFGHWHVDDDLDNMHALLFRVLER